MNLNLEIGSNLRDAIREIIAEENKRRDPNPAWAVKYAFNIDMERISLYAFNCVSTSGVKEIGDLTIRVNLEEGSSQ